MEIIEETSIVNYIEHTEDKEYNRYIQSSLTGIDETIIRKIIYFKEESLYLIYTNESFKEAYYKWQMRMLSNQKSS